MNQPLVTHSAASLWQFLYFPSTPLFHSVDRSWRSANGITFTFHLENEADAISHIAGLTPFLKETANPWYMSLFFRHTLSIWDTKTRQAYSAEEAELDNLLDDNNELNFTNDHSMDEKKGKLKVHIQPVADLETFPTIYKDTD
jgi:hypothetical protein